MLSKPNHSRPKLMFLVNSLPFFFSHRVNLAKGAQECGYEVHVSAPHNARWEQELVRLGLEFHAVPFDRKGMNPLYEIKTFIRIFQILREIKPDVLHLVALKAAAYGGIVARILSLRGVICAVAGLGYSFSDSSLRAQVARIVLTFALRAGLYKRATVIFQNPDDLQELVNRKVILKTQAVLIKGAGVNITDFAPSVTTKMKEGLTVVLVARMLWDKGIKEFYEAARILRKEGYDARFVLIGGVDNENPNGIPESTLRDWQCEGYVEWLGHVEDVPSILRNADIACLPSFYGEGLPKSLIEAASCGLPIVTTDSTGCREICRDGWNGVLVPPKEAKQLSLALKRLLDSETLRITMGSRGRKMVEAEYAEKIVVESTLSLYQQCLG